MGTRNTESNQGDGGPSSAPAPSHQISSRAGNTVFKSGPLFISSKGIGWTSWKKRWFILTRTSLVFFRSDPSIVSQRGSEVNLTLGGIDLNSSGSVVVKEDKKLLTVLFPDGRDGRAFTLKAETSEDLYDWKTALENALAQAPSAALAMGQNGIFRNDQSETASEPVEGGVEQWTDRRPVTSMVIGRPILLALEDIDGTPSFLEKALTFLEEYGVKVEGILRQSADVDDVNRRVREYEEGKTEFSSEEDAHVIADCVKHVLRALPSSPVPASCCNALLEACKADRGVRINAMRTAVAETFPEPNRRLLQRILRMMQVVASHKSENRMSSSAVSACMAPLLLRPLLAGDCELGNDFTMGGDGSHQLLQAAAAANHAQAIVITLLEEYENIFGEGSELYTDSEESGSEGDEVTDDDDDEILEDDDDTYEDEEGIDSPHNLDVDREDEDASSGTISESSYTVDDQSDNKGSEDSNSEGGSAGSVHLVESPQMRSGGSETSFRHNDNVRSNGNLQGQHKNTSQVHTSDSRKQIEDVPRRSLVHEGTDQSRSFNTKSTYRSNEPLSISRRTTVLGRTSARKNLSMESIDYAVEEDEEIQKLEFTKTDLQNKIAREVKENEVLHASLEDRKKTLHERRLALEQDVVRLREQLQKEKDLRMTMEARLNNPLGHSSIAPTIDNKTKAELEEISQAEEDVVNLKEKVADLQLQLSQQNKNKCGSVCGTCGQPQKRANLLERQDRGENLDATTATSLRDRSRNSDDVLSRADSGNVRTEETPSLSRKQQSEKQQDEKQQMALTVYEGAKFVGTAAPSSLPRKQQSEKQQDEKQQRDLTVHEGAKSVGTAAPSSLPRKQQSEKQHDEKQHRDLTVHDGAKSVGDAAPSSLPTKQQMALTVYEGAKSVGAAAPSSLPRKQQSEKQQDEKQQMDLTVHEGAKSVGAAAPSSLPRKQQGEKQQDEKQQMDLTLHEGAKSVDAVGPSCPLEPVTGAPNASSIRKSGTKVEGTAGTSSALTKLTTRLNFLKERRSQIVSELQNIENNRSSDTHLHTPSRTNSR